MRPAGQSPALIAHIHTAHARGHCHLRFAIKPLQLALDLQGQLTGWGNDQSQRVRRAVKHLIASQKTIANGQTKADRLTRSGLRRDQQVRLCQFWRGDGQLNGSQSVVAALFQRVS